MNSSDDFRKSLEDTYSDIFGDSNPDEDVSLENALKARQMTPKQVEKVKVFDTELGWVEEFVTVDAPTFKTEGTLREAVLKYGQTFPANVIVTFDGWKGTQRIMSVVGDIERGSVDIIKENGDTSTFNSLSKVEVTVTEPEASPESQTDESIGGGDMDIRKGDYVRVNPHTLYGDLRGGCIEPVMHTHQHNGYRRVKVSHLFDDELGGTIVEVEFDGGMVDEVSAEYCEKIN